LGCEKKSSGVPKLWDQIYGIARSGGGGFGIRGGGRAAYQGTSSSSSHHIIQLLHLL
jgi:hypothetical protein